jgi:hypothetical protein
VPMKSIPDDGALRSDMGPGVSPQDPTALTTQQLLRENFWLRELLQEQIAGLGARMEAGDKAVRLLQAFADRTPTTMDVEHQVKQLREVVMEKFSGVTDMFATNATALTAALQAQEKQAIATNEYTAAANEKMERGFTKQLDMLGETRKADMSAIEDKISGIKERITIIESRTSISDPSTQISLAEVKRDLARLTSTSDITGGKSTGQATLWALIVGALGLIIGLGTFAAMVAKVFK